MKLFERLFSQEPKSEVAALHPDFKIKKNGWYFNRDYNIGDGEISVKVCFGFDDPLQLNGCNFQAKIGVNTNPTISNKYIGFAYTRSGNLEKLESWAQRFLYAELIDHLDHDGVSTSKSNKSVLTKLPEEEN